MGGDSGVSRYTPRRAQQLAIQLDVEKQSPYSTYLKIRRMFRRAVIGIGIILASLTPLIIWPNTAFLDYPLLVVDMVSFVGVLVAGMSVLFEWEDYQRDFREERLLYRINGGRKGYRRTAPNALQYDILLRLQRLKGHESDRRFYEVRNKLRNAYRDAADKTNSADIIRQIDDYVDALNEIMTRQKGDTNT